MSNSKKNYLYNLSLTVINLLFPIISFPYVSRILGPFGIGKVQFVISFAQYFALFAALGIPVYGIREIAKVKDNFEQLSKTFSELILIYVGSSIIIGVCFLIIVFNLPSISDADHLYYYLGSLIIFIGFSSIDWFYAGLQEFKVIAIRSTVIKILALVFMFLFVKTVDDLLIYFIITIFTLLGNNLINIVSVWRKVKLIVIDLNFKRHKLPLILIFSTTIASSMYTLFDVIILGFLSDEKAVGYYTAGVKICKVCIPLVTSLGIVLMPKIAAHIAKNELQDFYSLIEKSFSFVVFISIPIGFGLFALSHEFIMVFSGIEFLPSVPSMQILSFMPFVIGMGYLLGIQMLIAGSKDKEMLISVSLGMVSSLILNLILIPLFVQEGAAIANIVSEIIVSGSYFYFSRKYYSPNLQLNLIFKAIGASVLFLPLIYYFKNIFSGHVFVILFSSVISGAIIYITIQSLIFQNELVADILLAIKKKLKFGNYEG